MRGFIFYPMNAETKYFLKTKRLGFRSWEEKDLDLALGLWGDEQVTHLIDARGKLSEQQVRNKLQKEILMEKSQGIQYWPIFLLQTGEHVGCCGLRPYPEAESILEIGFHIRSNHWRFGYGYEAAVATILYAFETLRTKALFAAHHPNNDVSRKLILKLGFTYSHDEFYEPTGLNHLSYMLQAEDYKTKQHEES